MSDRLPLACMYINKQGQNSFGPWCQGVHDGLITNVAIFPTPPITLVSFQALITAYETALADAALLGKLETQAKNSAKENLIIALRSLTAYVNSVLQQMVSSGVTYAAIRTIILSTGYFESQNPDPIGPLGAPVIKKYRSTVKGQLAIQVGKLKGAHSYQTLYGINTAPFTQLTFVSQDTRIKIEGLQSGVAYFAMTAGVGSNRSAINYSSQIVQVIQ